MKVRRIILSKSLAIMSGILGKELAYLVFSSNGNGIEIRGTSYEAKASIRIPGEAQGEEMFTLPRIVEKIGKIPAGEEVEFKIKDKKVKVEFSGGSLTLPTVEVKDTEEVEVEPEVEFEAARVWRNLRYAASFHPGGYDWGDIIQIAAEGGKCFMIGTNNIVLNAVKFPCEGEGKINCHLSLKHAKVLLKVASLMNSSSMGFSRKGDEVLIVMRNDEMELKVAFPIPARVIDLRSGMKKILEGNEVEGKVKIPVEKVGRFRDTVKFFRELKTERMRMETEGPRTLILSGGGDDTEGRMILEVEAEKAGVSISVSPAELSGIVSAMGDEEMELRYYGEDKPIGIVQRGEEVRFSLIAPVVDV